MEAAAAQAQHPHRRPRRRPRPAPTRAHLRRENRLRNGQRHRILHHLVGPRRRRSRPRHLHRRRPQKRRRSSRIFRTRRRRQPHHRSTSATPSNSSPNKNSNSTSSSATWTKKTTRAPSASRSHDCAKADSWSPTMFCGAAKSPKKIPRKPQPKQFMEFNRQLYAARICSPQSCRSGTGLRWPSRNKAFARDRLTPTQAGRTVASIHHFRSEEDL